MRYASYKRHRMSIDFSLLLHHHILLFDFFYSNCEIDYRNLKFDKLIRCNVLQQLNFIRHFVFIEMFENDNRQQLRNLDSFRCVKTKNVENRYSIVHIFRRYIANYDQLNNALTNDDATHT